jgi:hypothetical protein
MQPSGLRNVVEQERGNAVLAWLLVSFLLVVVVSQLVVGETLWALFVLVVAILAVVPAVAYRNPLAMLPWEVLAIASLPAVGRALVAGQTIGQVTLTGRVTTYLAVAAVALIVAVEVDVFTPVRMSYSFAVLFVVITTMAAAGLWAVAKWLSDGYLGTGFFAGDPELVETALMWDFVAATVAGIVAGVLFEFYFRRRARLEKRLPMHLLDVEEES